MTELQAVETEKAGDDSVNSQPSLGAAFLAARTAKNLTQQDVSNHLRYSVKQVDALESNNFHLLPDAMITRGFIRNYAKLLEIDAEPLLAIYRTSVADNSNLGLTVQSSIMQVPLTKDSQSWVKYILGSIVVLLLLLSWLFYVDYMPKPAPTAVAVQSENSPQITVENAPTPAEPLPEIALPAAERAADADSAAVAAIVPEASNVPAGGAANAALKPQAEVVAQPAVSALSNQAATKPGSNVTLTFSGDSWARITDKSGKVVYEEMSHAGDTDSVDVTPPVNVLIGNASVTKLAFRGKEIDLSAHTKNNIARIALE